MACEMGPRRNPERREVHPIATMTRTEKRHPPLALPLLCIVLLVAAVPIWLSQTAHGRAWVSERLTQALSGEIPGSVRADSLDSLGLTQLSVRGLRFEAETGETVLRVDRARLHYAVLPLLRGAIRITQVEVQGGELVIEELENGDVPLEYTFAPRAGRANRAGEAADLSIRNVVASDLTVVLKLQGLDPLTIEDVHALARVELQPSGYSEVRFERAGGHLPESPIGSHARVSEVSGHVRGKAIHVLSLDADIALRDDAFQLHLDYYNRDETPVEIRVRNLGISLVALRTRALALGSEFTSMVDIHVED